jgi:hypothetical protein
MLIQRLVGRLIAAMVFILTPAAIARADERAASDLLPQSTVIYAEIHQPRDVLNAIYDHELVGRIESLDNVREAMEKKPYLDFKAGLAIVESQMGMPWRKLAAHALGGGVAIAVDGKTKGAVVLARATDKSIHAKLLETLANLASFDAKAKGNPDPVKSAEFRGIKVYTVDKSRFAVVDDWLIVTNNDDLGKQIVERCLYKKEDSLTSYEQFAKARGSAGASPTAWAYVDTRTLRDAGLAKKTFGGHAENPLAELFFGGILAALKETPYVALRLDGWDGRVRIAASAPYDHAWSKDGREFFFGPDGKGVAPPTLTVDGTILSVSSFRDISGMWLRAGDLFDERMNEELTKADSGLTTLFGGKDFGEDILGAIQPELQLVVARQSFEDSAAAPIIKLPAFGLVTQLKDPAKMQPELRRTFQSMVGFLNIVGAMNGQPQLDLDMEKTDAAQFVTASYIPDPNAKPGAGAKVNYNFSPSIAFVGSRFVVASTKAFAHALASANPLERTSNEGQRTVNTDGVVVAAALRDILTDNRQQLVAQNMLREGHTKEEAERDVGVLLELIGWLDRLEFSMDTTQNELRLSLDTIMTQPVK